MKIDIVKQRINEKISQQLVEIISQNLLEEIRKPETVNFKEETIILINPFWFPTIPSFIEGMTMVNLPPLIAEWKQWGPDFNKTKVIHLAHPRGIPQPHQYIIPFNDNYPLCDLIPKRIRAETIFGTPQSPTCLWALWGLDPLIEDQRMQSIRLDSEHAVVFTPRCVYHTPFPIKPEKAPRRFKIGVFASIPAQDVRSLLLQQE